MQIKVQLKDYLALSSLVREDRAGCEEIMHYRKRQGIGVLV